MTAASGGGAPTATTRTNTGTNLSVVTSIHSKDLGDWSSKELTSPAGTVKTEAETPSSIIETPTAVSVQDRIRSLQKRIGDSSKKVLVPSSTTGTATGTGTRTGSKEAPLRVEDAEPKEEAEPADEATAVEEFKADADDHLVDTMSPAGKSSSRPSSPSASLIDELQVLVAAAASGSASLINPSSSIASVETPSSPLQVQAFNFMGEGDNGDENGNVKVDPDSAVNTSAVMSVLSDMGTVDGDQTLQTAEIYTDETEDDSVEQVSVAPSESAASLPFDCRNDVLEPAYISPFSRPPPPPARGIADLYYDRRSRGSWSSSSDSVQTPPPRAARAGWLGRAMQIKEQPTSHDILADLEGGNNTEESRRSLEGFVIDVEATEGEDADVPPPPPPRSHGFFAWLFSSSQSKQSSASPTIHKDEEAAIEVGEPLNTMPTSDENEKPGTTRDGSDSECDEKLVATDKLIVPQDSEEHDPAGVWMKRFGCAIVLLGLIAVVVLVVIFVADPGGRNNSSNASLSSGSGDSATSATTTATQPTTTTSTSAQFTAPSVPWVSTSSTQEVTTTTGTTSALVTSTTSTTTSTVSTTIPSTTAAATTSSTTYTTSATALPTTTLPLPLVGCFGASQIREENGQLEVLGTVEETSTFLGGVDSCGLSSGQETTGLWYFWEADVAEPRSMAASTCGTQTTLDTEMYLLEASSTNKTLESTDCTGEGSASAPVCVAWNDQGGQASCEGSNGSELRWVAHPGKRYYFFVTGHRGDLGTFRLKLSEVDVSDSCPDATPIALAESSIGSTRGAVPSTSLVAPTCQGVDPSSPTMAGVWYHLTGVQQPLFADIYGLNEPFSGHFAVYSGASCDQLQCITAESDATSNVGLSWNANAFTNYFIFVGSETSHIDFQLTVGLSQDPGPERPENDVCENAERLDALSDQVVGTTEMALVDNQDSIPECPGNPRSNPLAPPVGLWYEIRGNDRSLLLTTCEADTNFGTQISIFRGRCDELECIAVNENDAADCATLGFFAERRTDYFVFVSGYGSRTGTFGLTVDQTDELADLLGVTWAPTEAPIGP